MKTTSINFRLSEEEKEAIKAICDKRDISMAQFIREAIRVAIKEEK